MKFFGKKKTQHKIEKRTNHVCTVYSPTNGRIVPLNKIDDEVFKQEIMGKGVGIIPEIFTIYSPVKGTVKYIPVTKHAIIVSSEDGLEVLIHIGIDTVKLKGQHFKLLVDVDENVKVGDPLLSFNKNEILKLGFDLVIPVIITNSDDFSQVILTNKDKVVVEDHLIDVHK